MSTNYDDGHAAEDYRDAKRQPWRTAVEAGSFLGLIGDVTGRSVVDLACGEGHYTRKLRRAGAEIVGVDLSTRMIDLAREEESRRPLGIDYRVGDGRSPGLEPRHDLVVAAYLLNYARDRDELEAMCRGVASCLRPGGRFVTVNSNPALAAPAPSYRRYGFEVSVADEAEGAAMTWIFHLDAGPLKVENYRLSAESHQRALGAAGFRNIAWHAPTVSRAAVDDHGEDFWRTFLEHPPIILLSADL